MTAPEHTYPVAEPTVSGWRFPELRNADTFGMLHLPDNPCTHDEAVAWAEQQLATDRAFWHR